MNTLKFDMNQAGSRVDVGGAFERDLKHRSLPSGQG